MANYGLTFIVDAPYLLEEGVDVADFPVLVKIPIANTTNLYDKGETADTIYFESEGVQLKHELIEITATYCTAWVKMDLEADSKKVVTLHYGALVDNNYEDKRAVWVNGVNIYHFNGDATDSMGNNNGTGSAGILYDYEYGMHYKGVYSPANNLITLTSTTTITQPFTIIALGSRYLAGNIFGGGSFLYYNADNYFGPYPQQGQLSAKFADLGMVKMDFGTGTYISFPEIRHFAIVKTAAGNNVTAYDKGGGAITITYTSTIGDALSYNKILATVGQAGYYYTYFMLSDLLVFNDIKSQYWILALLRMYNNPDAYIEYGTEVDLDALTALDIDEADCVANVTKQLGIYDVDFRNIMYEIGDFNATWRLPGTEGITIWGIYQPRPVGDYYFPEMDNLGINDALFFTVTDYLVDIHDKIDIEGVRFDLQAIQVHPIADQKIYKMCVLKRQPEYYATCTGTVS